MVAAANILAICHMLLGYLFHPVLVHPTRWVCPSRSKSQRFVQARDMPSGLQTTTGRQAQPQMAPSPSPSTKEQMAKTSIPPASTPMCDEARAIHVFKLRLAHYRTCPDPRCRARLEACRTMALTVIQGLMDTTPPSEDFESAFRRHVGGH
jgi:hypothetical protein